jgi:hypothetical protein
MAAFSALRRPSTTLAGGPGGRIQAPDSLRASPNQGRICGRYGQVPALVPLVAAGHVAAEQDLAGQAAAWFGFAEGLMNRN